MLDFKKKPIIAMLHMASDREKDALTCMKEEVEIYMKYGVDAVLVENYFGDEEDCEAGLAWIQKEHPEVCYGVNILGDYEKAFYLADKYGADFIQIDSVCGHLRPRLDKIYEKELQALETKYPHVQVLGGCRFKYQPIRSERTLEEDLEISKKRCTAIVTTGDGTGIMTPTKKLIEFWSLLDGYPLIVGAGVTLESLSEQLSYVDGVIVGSWIKKYHSAEFAVDPENVRLFMEEANRWRKR